MPIDYQARRARALQALGTGVAVLPAAPGRVRLTAGTGRPDADFVWLTGHDDLDAILVLAPGAAAPVALFLPARDPRHDRWEGPRLAPEDAPAALGVDVAYPLAELEARLPALLRGADPLWYGLGRVPALDQRLLPHLGNPRRLHDPGLALHGLRRLKGDAELAAMRRAAAITAEGFAAARALVADGAREFELEAALIGTWRRLGADGPAYRPIVAGGANATVLHHTRADGTLRAGELVLVDAGAAWDGYACDVTRTWTVGRPAGRRATLLELVQRAQDVAIAAIRPGVAREAPKAEAEAVLAEGLRALGLDAAGLPRWFPHGLGHAIGLEVQDPSDVEPYAAGMTVTVEPGLYFMPDDDQAPADLRGVGVRIEDTVLVTPGGCERLSAAC